MKIHNSKNKKSWSIRLCEDTYFNAEVIACDSGTGKHICYLIGFVNDGSVILYKQTKSHLFENGYNPYEHGNKFDKEGRIIIGDQI